MPSPQVTTPGAATCGTGPRRRRWAPAPAGAGCAAGHPARHAFGVTLFRVAPEERTLSGLVTLALLAILCAYIVTRVMRRMGMGMSRNSTVGLMFVFVLVVLMVWGQTIK
jgi:hypothetical protein